jgi:hypothetical protein
MPDEPQNRTAPPIDMDLRARGSTRPLSPDSKRFDIFVIDTGWNAPISKVVRSHLRLLAKYKMKDDLYELTPEQSAEVVKHEPTLIGCDPTIIFYDRFKQWDRERPHELELALGVPSDRVRTGLVRSQPHPGFPGFGAVDHSLGGTHG